MLSDESPSQEMKYTRIIDRSNVMCPKCYGKCPMSSRNLRSFRSRGFSLDHRYKQTDTQSFLDLPPRCHVLNMIPRRRSQKSRHHCHSRSPLTLNQRRHWVCFEAIHGHHKQPYKMRHNPCPACIYAQHHAAREHLEIAIARSRGAASSREEWRGGGVAL